MVLSEHFTTIGHLHGQNLMYTVCTEHLLLFDNVHINIYIQA